MLELALVAVVVLSIVALLASVATALISLTERKRALSNAAKAATVTAELERHLLEMQRSLAAQASAPETTKPHSRDIALLLDRTSSHATRGGWDSPQRARLLYETVRLGAISEADAAYLEEVTTVYDHRRNVNLALAGPALVASRFKEAPVLA
ncbi:hypothetical protein [Microbacterium testaceum]|uniref:hypothetical protein n=1 Tax=Microbacterium testaceum TaxID=2033 RepID=UPI00128F7F1A|nr:hypothetical protein [Microbacterium testaceum]